MGIEGLGFLFPEPAAGDTDGVDAADVDGAGTRCVAFFEGGGADFTGVLIAACVTGDCFGAVNLVCVDLVCVDLVGADLVAVAFAWAFTGAGLVVIGLAGA